MKKKRVVAMFFTMLLLFLGVDARIYYLALLGNGSVQTAGTHGSYTLKISGGRGAIYDRNMEPLVNINSDYVAVVAPNKDIASQLSALSPHVTDQSALMDDFKKGLPFTITVNTPFIDATGINVIKTQERYGKSAIAPHITGYVDGDGNGVSGIEKAYDDILKKYTSSVTESFAVDAQQRTLSGVTPQIITQGDDSGGVVLTLDKQIQLDAQTAADKYLKSGAVIVMDIKTGDILASVSEPEYSPLNVSAAIKQSDSPLINRVFTSYNLGSIFKIAVASAALKSGISTDFTYTCTGSVVVDGRTFRCEKTNGHGKEDMSLAFANSCNTYFITLGQKVGGAKILQMANLFGFGLPTVLAPGISTDAGQLPSAQELIQPAAVANFSFGQGDLMVTPVQVADMVSAVANGGLLPTARLVEGIYAPGGMATEYPGAVPDRVISPQIETTIKNFMIKTVDQGTGMPAKPTYGGAGGKTSTAQTGWVQNGKAVNQAWFAGFYPAQSPKYAIVAICENGTAGGADAGPVFKYIANSLAPSCGYPAVSQ
jgi:cell division protein FtsI/penicillin-binding protein 2